MRLFITVLLLGILSVMLPAYGARAANDNAQGATLYRQICHKCHSNPASLANVKNIVEVMRKPRFTMPKYGSSKLSDDEARAIESYIHSWAGK